MNRAETWHEERFRAVIYLVGDAGLNIAHACQLEAANFDSASRTILTGFKGKRARRLKISHELASLLEAWIRKNECKWAIPGEKRIGPWWHTGYWPNSPHTVLKAACLAAGIELFNFRQLRRFRTENPFWRPPAAGNPAGRPEPATPPAPALPEIRLGP